MDFLFDSLPADQPRWLGATGEQKDSAQHAGNRSTQICEPERTGQTSHLSLSHGSSLGIWRELPVTGISRARTLLRCVAARLDESLLLSPALPCSLSLALWLGILALVSR
jgi:hypothetical protein